jgi:hypothetical protein
MAELLLKHGADKTLRNREGLSAKDMAAEKGFTELADLLKE